LELDLLTSGFPVDIDVDLVSEYRETWSISIDLKFISSALAYGTNEARIIAV
jgi:hypothetical protein